VSLEEEIFGEYQTLLHNFLLRAQFSDRWLWLKLTKVLQIKDKGPECYKKIRSKIKMLQMKDKKSKRYKK
jgi:hypothetical protein